MELEPHVIREDELDEFKCMLFASVISAENDEFTEDQKQEVIQRYNLNKDASDKDWEFIFEPVDKTGKLAKLFDI